LFEVTQPRVTCYRVGIRMNEPKMAALLVAHGRPGFYFRVLEEGEVKAGDEIVRVAVQLRAYERVRDQCAALHARSPARSTGAGAAHPGAERRLARFL
jgi:MOSC domain-containing protein YiiM